MSHNLFQISCNWGWYEWSEIDADGNIVRQSGPQNLRSREEAWQHYRKVTPTP